MSRDIIKIKLHRRAVRHYPFDIVYLVPVEYKTHLPCLFPWSLCIPFTGLAQNALMRALKTTTHHETKGYAHPPKGRRVALSQKEIETHYLHIEDHLNSTQYFLLVPVLTLWKWSSNINKEPQCEKKLAYFIAPQHALKRITSFTSWLTDDAVLFTPRGPLRPICKICPNSLNHLRNECSLGGSACRVLLDVIRSTDEQLPKNNPRSADPALAE